MILGFSMYYFFFQEELKKELFISVALLSSILFPLFTILVWTYDWFRKRKHKQRILSTKPFSDLEKIGFTNKTTRANHNSLLDFVHFGQINECEIVFDIDIKRPKIAEFQIYGRTWDLENAEFLQKSKELKSHNIDFNPLGFKKYIDTKTKKPFSTQELEKVLIEFTHIVKKLKYKPIPLKEWENK